MAVTKEPCEHCGSADNLTKFDNGSQFCFTPLCKFNETKRNPEEIVPKELLQGVYAPLANRRISQRTCEVFGYMQGTYNGQPCHIANIYNDKKQLTAQQIRLPDKDFRMLGDVKDLGLVGKHLWGATGKSVVITEGYIDMLSIGESQDCRWPVVTVPNGAQSAVKAIKRDLAWLMGYDSVILCFDNDEAGNSATEQCATLLPPGKVKIAKLSEKDANDVLTKGKTKELTNIVFTASEFRPDGIVAASEINLEDVFTEDPVGLSLPYPILSETIRGLKKGRIYTIYAGTGNGKTSMMKEILYHIRMKHPKVKIGNIFLEESKNYTVKSYICLDNNIPTYQLEENKDIISQERKIESYDRILGRDKDNECMYFYNHFGSLDTKRLFGMLEYLAVGKGVQIIALDHISILISGMESFVDGERRALDTILTGLRQFTERTGCILILATQLKRTEGSYNNGAEINEASSRGCVDSETEYLTLEGWKKIKDFKDGDLVGTFNKENRYLEFENVGIDNFIKKKADKFYKIKSIRGIDQVVSPEHGMLYIHSLKDPINKCSAEEYVNRHAKSCFGNRARFLTTFKYAGGNVEIDDKILRVLVAYQADGTLSKRPLCHVFKFTKERKYLRLKKLLEEAGLKFKDYGKFRCGQYCIETKIPGVFKQFPLRYYGLTEHSATILIDELKYWDCELSTGRYCTTIKHNSDFIQFCYARLGTRAIITVREKSGNWKTTYNVSPSQNNTVSLYNKDSKPEILEHSAHDGFKYCFTTATGAWVARRNSRIFITSNSGAIEHLSDAIISINCGSDALRPNLVTLKVLKNRISGIRGNVDQIEYNPKTGRYLPVNKNALRDSCKKLSESDSNEEDLI